MLRRLAARLRGPIWLLPQRFGVDVTDVVYRQVGAMALLARVYRPVGTAAFAAVLDVHGGDWVGGDRLQQHILDRSLAANGVLVVAIDYRLAPRHPVPAALEDVIAAGAWLKDLAEIQAPIGVSGSSAGGHLALLAALRMPLAFAIADAPVSDPVADLKHRGTHPFWPDTSAALEGSPLAALEAGRYRALPPLLISHGDRDELVPLGMSERFVAAYRSAGGNADLEVFRGLGHAFVLRDPRGRQSKLLARRMLAFIAAQTHLG